MSTQQKPWWLIVGYVVSTLFGAWLGVVVFTDFVTGHGSQLIVTLGLLGMIVISSMIGFGFGRFGQ